MVGESRNILIADMVCLEQIP